MLSNTIHLGVHIHKPMFRTDPVPLRWPPAGEAPTSVLPLDPTTLSRNGCLGGLGDRNLAPLLQSPLDVPLTRAANLTNIQFPPEPNQAIHDHSEFPPGPRKPRDRIV